MATEDPDELQSPGFQAAVELLEIVLLEGHLAVDYERRAVLQGLPQGLPGLSLVEDQQPMLDPFLPGDRGEDLDTQPLGLEVVEDDKKAPSGAGRWREDVGRLSLRDWGEVPATHWR